MAKIENTVAVTGTVTPTDTSNRYPVVSTEYIRGSLRQVETEAEMLAIFDEHKVEGMIVYIVEDDTFKMWKKDPDDNDTLKWMDANMGGGASGSKAVYNFASTAERDAKFPTDTLDQVEKGTLVYLQDEKKFQVLGENVDGDPEWQDVYEDVVHPYRVVDDVQDIKDTLTEGEMVYDKATEKLYVKGKNDTLLDVNEKFEQPYKVVDDIQGLDPDMSEEGTLIYDRATDKLYVKGNDAFLEVQPEIVHPYLVIEDENGRPDPADEGTLVYQKDVGEFFVKKADGWVQLHEEVKHPYYIVDLADDLANIVEPEVGSLAYVKNTDKFMSYKRNGEQPDENEPDAYTWQESNMVGDATSYTNQTPTPEKVGGVEPGTTFDGMSIEEVLNMLLYPYQAPAFTTFSIAGTTNLEIGQEFSPTTMSWNISNANNAKLGTITASFNGNDITISDDAKTATGNGVAMNGAQAVTKTTPGTATATITAQNSKGQNFTKSASVSWNYKIFKVLDANNTITADKVTDAGSFATSVNGVHTWPAGGGYQFLIYPAAWGRLDAGKIKDDSSGLAFAVNQNHANITLERNGVQVEYMVLRSENWLGTPSPMKIG